MADTLKPKTPLTSINQPERDEFTRMSQDQLLVSITRSLAQIAACGDSVAFIAEKWSLRNGIVTEKDLES